MPLQSLSRVEAMSCDDLTSASPALPAATPPAAPTAPAAGATPIAMRRQPGSALRRLELLAQAELRQMLGARAQAAATGIADPVWAGLAWDLGLNGSAIAAAGTAAPLPAYAALADHD